MKKLFGMAVLVAALGAQVAAHAGTQSGHIAAGNPVGATYFAAAISGDCAVGGPLDGTDGQWFAVQAGAPIAATLTAGATGVEDLDIYFFDDTCTDVGGELASDEVSESGTVPEGATRALVSLYTGADATFDLTLS